MNPDGTGRTQLTTNAVTDGFPVWSPDGTRIIFASGNIADENSVELFVMNADGSNRTQLTNNSVLDWFADLQPPSVPVSGKVTDINGVGIAGVTMTISGAPSGSTKSTLTDGSGNYSLNNTFGGDTLTPSKSGFIFDPNSVKAVSSGGPIPITGTFNFLAATAAYTVSGRVIDGTGAGLSGILITVTGSQPRFISTDGNGNYSMPGFFAGANLTFRPSQPGFVFLPAQVTFSGLPAGDRTLPTFVGTMHPYSITGQVKDNLNNPVDAVLLTLLRNGGTETVATSANTGGNFTLNNVAPEGS